MQTLWKRRAALLRKEEYQEVPELAEAMGMLEEGKFRKMVAFAYSEAGKKVRTNNHVERANRRLRFAEKVRYKWRRRKWVVRFVLLALDRWWRQAARAAAAGESGSQTSKGTSHTLALVDRTFTLGRNGCRKTSPGDFFVDSTCIDCDACRQIAPRSSVRPLKRPSSRPSRVPAPTGDKRCKRCWPAPRGPSAALATMT